MTSVGDLGEFELIARLARRRGHERDDVEAGIGDDAAALRPPAPGCLLLATCDVQVAGVHFDPASVDPTRLGRRAVAINVSDIAATGGEPRWLLSSLLLPPATPLAFVDSLAAGIDEEARRWEVALVGGNVSRAERLAVDLALLGEVAASERLARDGAAPGEIVLVTGSLGLAAAGLAVRQDATLGDEPARRAALDALELPEPRLPEARALAGSRQAGAAIDLSDGLSSDVLHVCEASGVGVRIDATALPLHSATRAIAAARGLDALAWALGGGEDYELLFTAPPRVAVDLAERVRAVRGTPVTPIGEIVPAAEGRTLAFAGGERRPLQPTGWRHF